MRKLKDFLFISDIGTKNLKKAVTASVIARIVMLAPIAFSVEIFVELLGPVTGGEINWNRLWRLFASGLLAALAMFIACVYEHRKTFVAAYSESERQRISVSERLRLLPMHFFRTKNLAEVTTSIMADCASIEKIVSHILPQLIATCIATLMISLFLFYIDWRLAVCLLVTIPLSVLVIWASRRIHKHWVERLTSLKLRQEDAVQEYIEGIKVTKSCRTSEKNFRHVEQMLLKMKQELIRGEVITGTFFTGSKIVLQCGTGFTIFAGVLLYVNERIDLIPILLFCMLSSAVYNPILSQFASLAELMYYRFATERMRQLMLVKPLPGKETPVIPDFNIKFDAVFFRYACKDIIKNLSTVFEENRITAIVGPSGSGKSTLVNLIARFWDVSSGSITVGGIDIKTIDPEYLMKHISIVFQDVILFNDTAYNNIKIGNMHATDAEVLEAARIAGCDDFISRLPEGYTTLLGENGSKLSGGERQRISIARALLKNAPVVILDEATASLDPENEKYVQDGITTLVKGKTVIVIAHKLRTITTADRIIVVKDGMIDEEGGHEELMLRNGLYKKLYTLQDASLQWGV